MRMALARHEKALRFRGLLAIMTRVIQLRRERQALLQLDRHLLKDVGLTAHQARNEATRPPWDAPERWRL